MQNTVHFLKFLGWGIPTIFLQKLGLQKLKERDRLFLQLLQLVCCHLEGSGLLVPFQESYIYLNQFFTRVLSQWFVIQRFSLFGARNSLVDPCYLPDKSIIIAYIAIQHCKLYSILYHTRCCLLHIWCSQLMWQECTLPQAISDLAAWGTFSTMCEQHTNSFIEFSTEAGILGAWQTVCRCWLPPHHPKTYQPMRSASEVVQNIRSLQYSFRYKL